MLGKSQLCAHCLVLKRASQSQPIYRWVLSFRHNHARCAHEHIFISLIELNYTTVAPVRNCQALWYIRAAFEILAMNTNNVLFFIRARAVYGKSRGSTLFFGFWWFVVFGTTLCALFAVQTDVSAPSNPRCEAVLMAMSST